VAGQLARLHEAGIDGVQLTFYDYLPELEYFGQEIVPLLEKAGLRQPAPGDQDGVTRTETTDDRDHH
jgi:FMNH2-dependent dimethyl sulfone monooxygenase